MVKFWHFIPTGIVSAVVFFAYRWFLLKTDVLVGYGWKCDGGICFPRFDIRNRSGSKTYVLGNIAYTKNDGKEVIAIDNKSIWGREIKPGTITYLDGAPVAKVNRLWDCPHIEVRVRMQNEREFKGQGPGQLYTGVSKFTFNLRRKLEKQSIPLA